MKTITIEIPDGKKAKWVNGVLTLVDEQPQDITERIKTFEDACDWCETNDKENLVLAYREICDQLNDMADMQDVFAYLKLRIITCALNEGWEPTFGGCEHRFYALYKDYNQRIVVTSAPNIGAMTPYTLYFKSYKLALYAAAQFKDIYMGFCYKGKE